MSAVVAAAASLFHCTRSSKIFRLKIIRKGSTLVKEKNDMYFVRRLYLFKLYTNDEFYSRNQFGEMFFVHKGTESCFYGKERVPSKRISSFREERE